MRALPVQSAQASPRRLKLLDGYIRQLRERYAGMGRGKLVTIVEFEQGAIAVGPWVAQQVIGFADAAEIDDEAVETAVAQAVSLMVKCKVDLARCRSLESAGERFQIQAELMLDLAVGTALVRRLQQCSDAALAEGEHESVHALSKLQHELRNGILRARQAIGESERVHAQQIADDLFPLVEDGPEEADSAQTAEGAGGDSGAAEAMSKTAADIAEADGSRRPSRPAPKVVLRDQAPSAGSGARWQFLALLMVAVAVWGGVQRFRGEGATEQPATRSVATASFGTAPGVVFVQDRHPYVVLSVDAPFWDERDVEARLGWVQELVGQAESRGYQGLVVRNAAGQPLAEWSLDLPARLLSLPKRSPN